MVLVAAALAELLEDEAVGTNSVTADGAGQGDPFAPWRQSSGFRMGATP